MDQLKKVNYYSVIKTYKGRIFKRSAINEEYRQKKIYSFYTELIEKLDSIWQTAERIFHALYPVHTLKISFGKWQVNLNTPVIIASHVLPASP